MYKYLFVFFSLFTSVNIVSLRGTVISNYFNNSVVAMVLPPSGFISQQAGCNITNKVNPPGCSTDINQRNLPNGDVQERRTVTCTTVTTIDPNSGQVKKQRPRILSSLHQSDCQMVDDFFKKREQGVKSQDKSGGSSGSNRNG